MRSGHAVYDRVLPPVSTLPSRLSLRHSIAAAADMARTRKSKKTSNVVSLHSSASSSSLLSAVPGFGTSTTLDGPSMQVRMQNVVNGTLALVASARPIATQKAYNRKQQEFIQWCDDQTDLDVHTK